MQGYKIFEYMEQFQDEQENWHYKSICEMKMHILLPPNPSDKEIMEAIDNAGYILELVGFERRGDDIEMIYKKGDIPIGIWKRVS